jgi:hypothetical protein
MRTKTIDLSFLATWEALRAGNKVEARDQSTRFASLGLNASYYIAAQHPQAHFCQI